MIKNQTQQQAIQSCAATGGFLTDIQNTNENSLMNALISTFLSSTTGSSA